MTNVLVSHCTPPSPSNLHQREEGLTTCTLHNSDFRSVHIILFRTDFDEIKSVTILGDYFSIYDFQSGQFLQDAVIIYRINRLEHIPFQ